MQREVTYMRLHIKSIFIFWLTPGWPALDQRPAGYGVTNQSKHMERFQRCVSEAVLPINWIYWKVNPTKLQKC